MLFRSGTGYSSLAYLSKLPVDTLKIDISFVVNLAQRQNEKVVNAIINLGHSLDLDIVAEGIETAEQRDYFVERGCEAMQGYFFQRPTPFEGIYEALCSSGSLAARAQAKRADRSALEAPGSLAARARYLRAAGVLRPARN